MPELELELTVGETLQIGGYLVTVVDIDGGEVAFRVDGPESLAPGEGEPAPK